MKESFKVALWAPVGVLFGTIVTGKPISWSATILMVLCFSIAFAALELIRKV